MKYALLSSILLIVFNFFLIFRYSSVHILGTLETQYHKIDNSSDQIIETEHFNIRAPKNWMHIYGGVGCGGYIGTFETWDSVIFYEYGLFTPNYDGKYNVSDYKIEKKLINNYLVNIARNENSEMGICIPKQNSMEYQLTFYMDKSVTKHFNDLIKGIQEIEFK